MGGEKWQCSVEELLGELRDRESGMCREYAVVLELVAELETRGAAAECGYRSVPELLKDVLRISTREAKRRVQHAHAVTEVDLPSGGSLPAPLPLTATALRAGAVGADHLDVITRALSDLPLEVLPEQRQAAEESLVDAARITDPRTLATFATQIRAYLDPDGAPPSDAELAAPINELRWHTKRNGRLAFTGELDPEAGALLRTILSPLAKPRPTDTPYERPTAGSDSYALSGQAAIDISPDPRTWADPDTDTDPDRDPGASTEHSSDGTSPNPRTWAGHLDPANSDLPGPTSPAGAGRDLRSAAERQGDALVELLHLAASTGGLPSEAGEKPHLLITVTLAELQAGVGHALLDGAGDLDAASARRIACDSKVIPAVLGSRSEILDLGRASYTVNHAIRRALVLRDNGCAFPGCGRPHQWQYR